MHLCLDYIYIDFFCMCVVSPYFSLRLRFSFCVSLSIFMFAVAYNTECTQRRACIRYTHTKLKYRLQWDTRRKLNNNIILCIFIYIQFRQNHASAHVLHIHSHSDQFIYCNQLYCSFNSITNQFDITLT